jgi:hypothetical protein
MRLHLCASLGLFTLLLLAPAAGAGEEEEEAPRALAGTVVRRGTVRLSDGQTLSGTIIAAGPRGVVMIAQTGSEIERFIPAEKIKELKTAGQGEEAEAAQPAGDLVRRYAVGAKKGQLRLTAAVQEKAADGNAPPPSAPKRSPLVKEPESPRRSGSAGRRRTILRTSRKLDDYKTRKSEKNGNDRQNRILDLFGGADEDEEKEAAPDEADDRLVRD